MGCSSARAIAPSPGCRSITTWASSASASRRSWRRAASITSPPRLSPAVPRCGSSSCRRIECTIAYSPSFGYDLAARRAGPMSAASISPVAHCRHRRRHGAAGNPRSLCRGAGAGRVRPPRLPAELRHGRDHACHHLRRTRPRAAHRCRRPGPLQAAPHRRAGIAGIARNARPDPRIRRLRPSAARP